MGYDVATEKLKGIGNDLRSGAESLDQVADTLPEAVDAGFSSDVANAALGRVGKIALALAQQGESMADNIDAAKGLCEAAEDSAEDEVHLAEKDLEHRQDLERGPLKEAEPESGAEEAKNSPKPTPATPGPTPEPPAPSN